MTSRSPPLPPKYFNGVLKQARWQAPPGHEHKYAIQMSPQGRGHALFDPYPGRHGNKSGETVRNPCVEIGDVGYVRGGSFRLLFNIHRQAEDALQIHGVPDGFTPLERRPNFIDHRLRPYPRMMHSSSKVAADITAEASVPGVTSIASSWSLQHERGASLAYFDRYEVWDAQDKARYLRYFRTNFRSWLEFISSMELGLSLKDIVLVTGCDRTRAWATLWSEFSSSSGSVSLQVQTSIGNAVKLTGSVQWQNAHNIPSLSGPPPQELEPSTRRLLEEIRDGDIASSPLSESSRLPLFPDQDRIAVPADQCMFIRGIRGREMFPATPFRLRGGGPASRSMVARNLTKASRGRGSDNSGRSSAPSKARDDPDVDVIEDVLGTPSNTVDSLVTVALDLVAELHNPLCENNILLMHDDDVAMFLPEPGDKEHALWVNMAAVRSYLAERLVHAHPSDMDFLTQLDGSFWVQMDKDVDLEKQLQAMATPTTPTIAPTTVQSPTKYPDARAALLKNIQLHLSQMRTESQAQPPMSPGYFST